jgi:hypothetical protein
MADEKVDAKTLKTFQQMVEESWRKNPVSILTEKGLPGTDTSFTSPVVSPYEYRELMKKLRKQYGEKRRPGEKKDDPFKGPIKKLEEKQDMKEWDKLIKRLDKIKDPKKRKFEEYKWEFEKWYFDTLKGQGSKVRQI